MTAAIQSNGHPVGYNVEVAGEALMLLDPTFLGRGVQRINGPVAMEMDWPRKAPDKW